MAAESQASRRLSNSFSVLGTVVGVGLSLTCRFPSLPVSALPARLAADGISRARRGAGRLYQQSKRRAYPAAAKAEGDGVGGRNSGRGAASRGDPGVGLAYRLCPTSPARSIGSISANSRSSAEKNERRAINCPAARYAIVARLLSAGSRQRAALVGSAVEKSAPGVRPRNRRRLVMDLRLGIGRYLTFAQGYRQMPNSRPQAVGSAAVAAPGGHIAGQSPPRVRR